MESVITTERESPADIPVLQAAPVRWPSPPFFQPATSTSPGETLPCELTLIDGRPVTGELMRFEPDEDTIELVVPERPQPVKVHLDRVRWIKRVQPVALVADEAALAKLGTTLPAAASGRRDLSISLQDGSSLNGKTQGFVKEKAGLFVFLVEDSSVLAVPCFIPARQIKNLQIGPLLGDMLVSRRMVTEETLAAALKEQTKIRTERIGEYLTERAILSREDLQRALLEQKKSPTARLGEVLVEAKLINNDQLQRALAIQAEHRERRLGDILIEMGAVSLQLIQVALADKVGIPYVNVRDFALEPAALRLVDPAFAVRKKVLPLLHTADSLVIAVENPLAMDFAQDLRFATGLTIVPVIAEPNELKARIAKEYSRLDARPVVQSTDTLAASKDSNRVAPERKPRAEVKVEELAVQLNREAPQPKSVEKVFESESRVSDNTLVRLINKIIVEAYEQGASDIHIESNPGHGNIRIRFRKDGDLEDYLELPPTYRNSLISRVKIMSDLDISEHRQPQDGKIEFAKYGPIGIELRVAIIPTVNGLEDVVLRILGAAEPRPLTALDFASRDLDELQRVIGRSYGLILVCGPTGSGKTTTLHSVLAHINRPDVKIWTAEDPVEITQPGLRQVQVQPKIGWNFAAAMRAFLRADPDVIMVGEMRDTETAKIGVEASLTGHLVFSTLHTNSAAESVVRLLDMGMDPFNFSDALLGVLGQRLARRLCTRCKRARPASEEEISALAAEYCVESRLEPAEVLQQWQSDYRVNGRMMLHEAVGCEACRGGYAGRVGIYELLITTPRLKDLVRARAPVPQLVEVACEGGMRVLRQDAIAKVLQGVLDLSSARAASS